ncbi:hypothetical protein [Leptospira sarikeiensis]|uniref:Uncharacterized protein n=1 Tax=Leptospira sarikeiensis TaxID=2484943 RepID=A0A4R9K579_9LEPT|nr:hypothetical protein [Leptospira sarikeiensis]TGL60427.1 hypothetical protein EHQ64_11315 [Leptospira sarikeiensis]
MFSNHKLPYSRVTIAVSLTLFSLVYCSKEDKSSKTNDLLILSLLQNKDQIAEALTSAMDPVSGSMEGLSGEGASVAIRGKRIDWSERLSSLGHRIWNKGPNFGELEAYNFSFNCWGGGNYQRQVSSTDSNAYDFLDYILNGNDPSSSFLVSKEFGNCRFLPFSNWVIDGISENLWSNLSGSSPFVQDGTNLKIGVNRTIQNNFQGISVKVTGTGTPISYAAGTPTTNQAYSLTWNNILTGSSPGISSYSQDVSVLREGYSGSNLLFSHQVSSTSPLQYGVDRSDSNPLSWYRLWSGGSLQVVHVEKNFTLTVSVVSPVKWKYVDCLPRSGQVSFTLSGDLTGTGSISFSNGSGNYVYTVTDSDGNTVTDQGSLDFSSCSVPLFVL